MTRKVALLLIVVLVLAAGIVGWQLGQSDQPDQPSDTEPNNANQATSGVKSLVSYELPDGWKEASCPSSLGAVFIIPAGAPDVDCDANPSSPVKMSVDPGDTKDCNELQNVQNVKKHVCISLYINDQRSLRASTEYLSSSSYKQDTTVNAYYIDTGEAVVKVEYIFSSDNQYQAGFDQLANSVKS